MKKALEFLDPKKRGIFFTHYGITGILFIAAFTAVFYFYINSKGHSALYSAVYNFTLFTHEFGHKLFHFLFFGNEFMTIIGGTAMEILTPLCVFLYFQRKGWEIQADICILFLALSFNSVADYSAMQQIEDEMILVNANPGDMGDWQDYMHGWFGTKGKEIQARAFFKILSSFTTASALWLLFAHIKRFIKEPPTGDEEGYYD
ncbi:MAG: hypothetical protein LBO62_05465 [Endomicrobium sp.]|jgi:hypothetical protein|nr:hypothetical protein [Endomicrobium sp.]